MKKTLYDTISYPFFALLLIFVSCNNFSNQEESYLFKTIDKSHSKVRFQNIIPEDKLTNSFFYEYVYNGGGVSVGDLNQDGLPDIYFTSNLHDNALYINQGNLKFKDLTEEAGVAGIRGWTTGVNMIDINNDNFLDLYICKSGPYEKKEFLQNELYINLGPDENGIPKFKESSIEYGLTGITYSIQSAFLDFDQDGDLDMYLMNHNPQTFALGNSEEISPLGDKFYVNENGRFVDKTVDVGIYSNAVSYGLGVGVGDLNNDGWPDLYISNDYDEPDYLYINNKNGSFHEVAKKSTSHISNFAMGNDIADFDNDGYLDMLTLDMVSEDNYGMKTSMASMNPQKFEENVANGKHYQYMYNTLQRHTSYIDSEGIPYFSEIGQIAGISNTDWSWGPLVADFDNDGFKDIFITNGIKRDFRNKDYFKHVQEFRRNNPDALTNEDKINSLVSNTPQRPYINYFYRNTGGLKFENTSQSWIKNPKATFSNGAAYGDLDNDGDLDLVINNVGEPSQILENTSNTQSNHFLQLELTGSIKNTKGIGAKVKVYTEQGFQLFENYSVRGYQSSGPPMIHIGLGDKTKIDSLEVIWTNDQMTTIYAPPIDTKLEVAFKDEENFKPGSKKIEPSYFSHPLEISQLVHKENSFDDYQKQVLLPHKMSQFGPAIAIGDINGDERDDLYLGQSAGETSSIYLQQPNGTFRVSQALDEDGPYEDIDAAFLDIDNDGDLDLYVASGGNEFEAGHQMYEDRLYENVNGRFLKRADLLPDVAPISSSKIAIGDYDADGLMDIFVGGRHIPHEYPSPATSYIFHNENGSFEEVGDLIAQDLQNIGLVTDATWLDFDNDGDEDLSIVGEWMTPTLLENRGTEFRKVNIDTSNQLTGWYSAISSHDIDSDGDLDIILGNLGENYKYKATTEEPFEVYYDDFDNNGQKDIVLSYYNFGELFPVRGRECSSQQIPEIKEVAPTYHDFGISTVAEIYGERELGNALHLSAHNFKSGILRNNGNANFEFIPFPELAQLSSINGILFKDLDGDKLSEIIIAGNLYASEIETPRNDAGYGLVLKNEGSCEFTALSASESGLFIPGDVKVLQTIKNKNQESILAGINNRPVVIQNIIDSQENLEQ